MKREETKLAVVLVALLVALSGCVYYNTFFNAERAYSDAEAARLRQSADGGSKTTRSSSTRRYNTTDYDRAIDKASRVLAFYPESDYVDDALVMLAKAFYWKREYANTIRKADELAANLPDSPLIPESLYWKALAIWRQGDAPKAKEMLDILRGRADDDLASQASYSLGQLAFEERRYSDSIIFYQEVLSRTKDEEQALEARGRIGYAWIELGDPRRAIPIFADLADNAVTYSARYNALTNLARAQRDLGNPEAALATLDGLEQDERFSDRIPETRVEIAHTHELGGDTSQAILLYQEIIDDAEFARSAATRQATRRDEDDGPQPAPTAEAGVAHFRLGRIRQDRFGDLWTARDHYQSAATGPSSPGDSTKIKAQKLVANIDRLGDLRDQLADTVGVPDTAATWFSIAEHLYLSMSMHDSALAYYDSVATRYPVHTLTPRSRYAAAWLTEHEIGDSVRSATMIDALLKDTTSSAAAIYVRRAIRRASGADTLSRAYRLFREAEDMRASVFAAHPLAPKSVEGDSADVFGAVDSLRLSARSHSHVYLDAFEELARTYRGDPYGSRSAYIAAWTLEEVYSDSANARPWYEQAAADSALSDLSELAHRRLGSESQEHDDLQDEKSVLDETPPEPSLFRPIITTQGGLVVRPMDTTWTTEPWTLDQPPVLIREERAIYSPQAAHAMGDQSIEVRVTLNDNGQVVDAEALTGPLRARGIAEDAARTSEFSPASNGGEPLSVMVTITINLAAPPEF